MVHAAGIKPSLFYPALWEPFGLSKAALQSAQRALFQRTNDVLRESSREECHRLFFVPASPSRAKGGPAAVSRRRRSAHRDVSPAQPTVRAAILQPRGL